MALESPAADGAAAPPAPPAPRGRDGGAGDGVIAVLDLPPGSSVSIDGCAPRAIRRDDFVGVSGVPPPSAASPDSSSSPSSGPSSEHRRESDGEGRGRGIHLVVVRGGGAPPPSPSSAAASGGEGETDRRRDRSKGAPAPAVGFLLADENARIGGSPSPSSSSSSSSERGWIFARRYDPRTEEPSSAPLDGPTSSNLLRSIREGSVGPQRVVPYRRFVGGEEGDGAEDGGAASAAARRWDRATDRIGAELLRRRGLRGGDKVVPGSYDGEEGGFGVDDDEKKEAGGVVDGGTPSYPPVPCVDPASPSPSPPARRGVHAGTRRYLAALPPSGRTALFLDPAPGSRVLRDVLEREYGGRPGDLLGDVQLAFVLFLHLGCLASFGHWRDLVCMLSFASDDAVESFPDLYADLVRILTDQLSSIERDFFEEVEYSGENFLLPALGRLRSLCSGPSAGVAAREGADALARAVSRRFGAWPSFAGAAGGGGERRPPRGADSSGAGTTSGSLSPEEGDSSSDDDDDEDAMEIDMRDGPAVDLAVDPPSADRPARAAAPSGKNAAEEEKDDDDDDEDDDEDGPVVVPAEEVRASLARSSAEDARLAARRRAAGAGSGAAKEEDDASSPRRAEEGHRRRYPLLFAALTREEDVLMACARILDEKVDAGLVREAAAYLEEVEAKKGTLDCL